MSLNLLLKMYFFQSNFSVQCQIFALLPLLTFTDTSASILIKILWNHYLMITGYFTLSIFLLVFVFIFFPLFTAKESSPTADHCFFQGKKTAVNLSVLPSLPPLCSLLINWDFAWLNFKRPLEKTALLGCESLNLSSELWVFKSQGIMRLPNGEDKIQQCTNYVRNWKLCDVSSQP